MLIARAGLASRRQAEQLIEDGEVTVNGRVITEPGARAVPGRDHVKVRGRLLGSERPREYWAYHKPVNCVTTMKDPEGRFCIGDVVEAIGGHGLFPVGRLDYASSGLLLLTNDGELAQRLTHPSFHIEKAYAVKVSPAPSREIIDHLRSGVRLRDGYTGPAYVREVERRGSQTAWVDVRIREGRNQQVRRMFEAFGIRVEKLRREALGPLTLGSLPTGDARRLRQSEVAALKAAVGMDDARRSRAVR
ncbi:MAG TPA: pseudouridine synthase [Candidatus Limnocylindrales bacterium]|nr:pseudouridine synthase [Candidatus Limnocylindrales bacterium]